MTFSTSPWVPLTLVVALLAGCSTKSPASTPKPKPAVLSPAGNLLAGGGSTLVAAGGGNLVAAGGGNLVAAGGGNLVAAGGGNLSAAAKSASAPGAAAAASASASLQFNDASPIVGKVLAPAGLVASGGGNLIAQGAGGLVASGGGNYRLASVGGQKPLAQTEIYLADATGKPYPNVAHVMTDALGRYHLPAVPNGFTYMVVASAKDSHGKDVQLKTLAETTAGGAVANLDVGSTLVATSMVANAASDLGNLDAASFDRAVAEVDTDAAAESVDLGDAHALTAYMDAQQLKLQALQQDMATLDAGIALKVTRATQLATDLTALAVARAADPTQLTALDEAYAGIPIQGTFPTSLNVHPLPGTTTIPAGTTLIITPVDYLDKAHRAPMTVTVTPYGLTPLQLPYATTAPLTFTVALHAPPSEGHPNFTDPVIGLLTITPGLLVTLDTSDGFTDQPAANATGYVVDTRLN